jgi:dehydrogenase E1 component/ATP synthase gamma subunit
MNATNLRQSPIQTDRQHGQLLLAEMLLIRRFEEKCAELYSGGKIWGFLHLYIGEEAVAVGAMPAIRPEDAVVSTYREHGHALARGVPASAVMAEMFGKANGCCRARGGSMHLFDVSRRYLRWQRDRRRWTAAGRRFGFSRQTAKAPGGDRLFLRRWISLYQVLLDALASEHGMRLTAAEAALQWIDQASEQTARKLSASRSEAATQELLDIVGGANERYRR